MTTAASASQDVVVDFAAPSLELQYGDLGKQTVKATMDALFDTVAVSLGGLTASGVPQARSALRARGSGAATLGGGHGTAPAPFAAITNAGALGSVEPLLGLLRTSGVKK